MSPGVRTRGGCRRVKEDEHRGSGNEGDYTRKRIGDGVVTMM